MNKEEPSPPPPAPDSRRKRGAVDTRHVTVKVGGHAPLHIDLDQDVDPDNAAITTQAYASTIPGRRGSTTIRVDLQPRTGATGPVARLAQQQRTNDTKSGLHY